MTEFLQLHLLTAYPPANLNRDDTGRPKTAIMGGVPRLRISSQSLKRAWRESEVFERKLEGHLGQRTQRLGQVVRDHLITNGMDRDDALRTATAIAGVFGKPVPEKEQTKKPAFIEQLAFISREEKDAAIALADRALAGTDITADENRPKAKEVLRRTDAAADIAMFGRMLADHPQFNREAATQVAHAITTHRVVPEDDYYTAVDDLKRREEADDAGAGFVGVQEFGAGLFYLYLCIDKDLLTKNLEGNATLANSAVAAIVEAAATVAPRGKQASFASRAYASYIMAERGPEQPRSLAAAFLKPIDGRDYMADSITALTTFNEKLATAYGTAGRAPQVMNVPAGEGSLDDIIGFATGAADA